MGTTSEKLTYLNETKQELKQKINNLGGDITSQTTFRQYANQLQNVYDNLPKTEYQEGTEINLGVTTKGKLDFEEDDTLQPMYKKVVIGKSEQDGTPTPSTPIAINSVTGNQDVVVRGKNEFKPTLQINGTDIVHIRCDASLNNGVFSFTATDKDWYFGELTGIGNAWSENRGYLIEVEEGQTYSVVLSNINIIKNFINTFDKNKISLGNASFSTNAFSYTIPTGVKYISLRIGLGNATIVGTTYETTILVAKGNDTTYEPYITPTSYQLSLGDIELNAIGNYKDELIYDVDEDRVYKKANLKSAILNSTNQTWETQSTNVTTKKRYSTNAFANEIVAPSISSNLGILMCNYYENQVAGTSGSYGGNQGISISSNGNIYINDSRYDNDINGWKTWLDSVICKAYYALQTPVETEITDTILINQVKALYNAHSNNGTTIITSNGNLPLVLKVRGLKGE